MKNYLGYVVIENEKDFEENAEVRDCGFDRYFIDDIMVAPHVEVDNFPLYLKRYNTPTGFQWETTTKETVVNAWKTEFEEEKKFFEELLKGVDN